MTRPDPIEILERHQAAALVRHGASIEEAAREAKGIVETVLNDLAALRLKDEYLYVVIRRARVYRMRSQGLTVEVIGERLGISRSQVKVDYSAEMNRRRRAEAA